MSSHHVDVMFPIRRHAVANLDIDRLQTQRHLTRVSALSMALRKHCLRLVGVLGRSYREASTLSQPTYSRREKPWHGAYSRALL